MELRGLEREDYKDIIKLFGEELSNYYFIVEDILKNNNKENFNVYGEYDNNKLVSILLNNFNNITYYSQEDRSVELYKELLGKLNFSKLSGPSKFMKKFLPYLEVKEMNLSYMGVMKELKAKKQYKELEVTIIKTEEELDMHYELLKASEEYIKFIPKNKKEYIINEIKKTSKTTDKIFCLKDRGRMMSACSTIREGEKSAIVVGVVTNPKYRNNGYGTEVLINLFQYLMNKGKYAYLFYNNPIARSVYKNMGIHEVCEWSVIEV